MIIFCGLSTNVHSWYGEVFVNLNDPKQRCKGKDKITVTTSWIDICCAWKKHCLIIVCVLSFKNMDMLIMHFNWYVYFSHVWCTICNSCIFIKYKLEMNICKPNVWNYFAKCICLNIFRGFSTKNWGFFNWIIRTNI